jgi:predicted  nucleic acid-binding Zn-ribbon protein
MRTRNQEKVPSSQSSSQQAARPNRKRRASSSSDAPIPQSSQTTVLSSSQIKRRKRQDASYDHPEDLTILDEEESVALNTPAPAARHVHFTESTSQVQKTTSTHLTPHIRKTVTTERRQTISPSKFEALSTPPAKSRLSLPSSFSSSPAVTKLFRPLSQVLSERVKSRLRLTRLSEEIKEQRDGSEAHQELVQLRQEIGEIEDVIRTRLHQLDVEKQLGEDADDQKMEDIEAELAQLSEDLADKKAQEAAIPDLDAIDAVDVINEDMMVFDSSQGILYPNLPSSGTEVRTVQRVTDAVDISDAQTQVALPDSTQEEERRAYKEAIQYWTEEASNAKSTLQILTIELQSLGFPGENSEAIIASIRESFASVRERLELAVPGITPSNISDADLVELVIQHLETLASKVTEQEVFIADNDQLRQELANEIDGLLERLSQAEIRKRNLEIGFNELDAQSQRDEQLIDSLSKELSKIEKNHDMAQTLISEKKAQLAELDRENRDQDSTILKLGEALEGYRANEANLQALITRMEQEANLKISDLTKASQAAVSVLEEQLRIEGTKRYTAEADADEKQNVITTLERRAEDDEANIDTLKQQLLTLQGLHLAEQQAREVSEAVNDENTTLIAELEVKIEQAETELDQLKADLDNLRALEEAERRQREAAEAELDDRNNLVTELEQKLLASGKQANELRQKLFEVQQRSKETVVELQTIAEERETKHAADLAAWDIKARDLNDIAVFAKIETKAYEDQLKAVTESMSQQLEERAVTIRDWATKLDQLTAELKATKKELNTALVSLDELQQASEARIVGLVADVADLQGLVAQHEATIKLLNAEAETTAQTHVIAITERNEKIADLNHDIYTAQNLINNLEAEKASLERRVESEAEQMLELQADRDDQIADLNTNIRNKQAEIENLGRKAQEVDRSWERVMNERNTEIEELRETGSENTLIIARMTKLNAALKEKFRLFVRDSTATVQAMQEDMEQAVLSAGSKGGELREVGRRVLEEVEAMDTVGEMVTIASSSSAANPRVKHITKQSRRNRRAYDSGIGVDEDSLLLEE